MLLGAWCIRLLGAWWPTERMHVFGTALRGPFLEILRPSCDAFVLLSKIVPLPREVSQLVICGIVRASTSAPSRTCG